MAPTETTQPVREKCVGGTFFSEKRTMCYFCSDVIHFQESPQEFVGRYTSLHMYVCDHLQDCNQDCKKLKLISTGEFEDVTSFPFHAGASYNFEKTDNGIFRLKLTANAKKIIADLRRPLEILMKGNTINHPDLTISAVQLLLSHDGVLIQLVILKERLENLYCTRRTPASREAAAARG
ncbi:hypothetical protein CFC21_000592 [Triticum aestivum]|uniref:Uncharacterized protein n=1 Tax=Triticum aestivum TaxID=4565 RepID=A0A3B5XVL4_WHEAT|nr:hypothetical protein CFC21_000592 [Triticum aestivum]